MVLLLIDMAKIRKSCANYMSSSNTGMAISQAWRAHEKTRRSGFLGAGKKTCN
jgi:hypothetical protein